MGYDGEAIGALTLAYASTIHKVQGSEFPAVVLLLHGTHYMLLSRPLLYTAITRRRVCRSILTTWLWFARKKYTVPPASRIAPRYASSGCVWNWTM